MKSITLSTAGMLYIQPETHEKLYPLVRCTDLPADMAHSPPDIVMGMQSPCAAEHRATGVFDDPVPAAAAANPAPAFLNPAVPAGKRPEPIKPCVPMERTVQAAAIHEGRIVVIVPLQTRQCYR